MKCLSLWSNGERNEWPNSDTQCAGGYDETPECIEKPLIPQGGEGMGDTRDFRRGEAWASPE